MSQRRVNVDMSVATARSKVFVFEFAQRNHLGNSLSMRPLNNIKLVFLAKSKHDQVTVTLAANQQFSVFSSHIHRREGFVHFVCVCNSLREFVPQFDWTVSRTCQKFVIARPANSINGICVGSFRFEVSFTNEHIRVHFRVRLCLIRLGLSCAVVARLVCFHLSLSVIACFSLNICVSDGFLLEFSSVDLFCVCFLSLSCFVCLLKEQLYSLVFCDLYIILPIFKLINRTLPFL